MSNDLEPNDTIALAQSMSLYGAAEGHLGLLDYSGVESANDIDDWWRLTVSTRGELTLELSATSIDERGGPIAAALYDSNGNAVGSIGGIGALSANNGNVESHTFSVEPGVYQLEVDHGSDYYGTRGIWVYTVTPTYVPEVTAVEDFFLY